MRRFRAYLRVLQALARNSLVRDMTFRFNFLTEVAASALWTLMHLAFWLLLFGWTPSIGVDTGWGRHEFFVFIATMLMVQSLMQTFFLPNAEMFAEQVRSGELDLLLTRPIDTQFLTSLARIQWASLSNFIAGMILLGVSLPRLAAPPPPVAILLYPFYLICGVAILYGIMLTLASTAVWMGRNSTLLDSWFCIMNFTRYPSDIFAGSTVGRTIQFVLTFLLPVLLAINVPARILVRPLTPHSPSDALMPTAALVAAVGSLWLSRRIFYAALNAYRSASS